MSKDIRNRISLSVAASAIALVAITGVSLAGPLTPHNGDCKHVAQVAVAASPGAAQQAWVVKVTNQFGPKWAIWVGAKNKVVVSLNQGTLYQASATPCFYQPVL